MKLVCFGLSDTKFEYNRLSQHLLISEENKPLL